MYVNLSQMNYPSCQETNSFCLLFLLADSSPELVSKTIDNFEIMKVSLRSRILPAIITVLVPLYATLVEPVIETHHHSGLGTSRWGLYENGEVVVGSNKRGTSNKAKSFRSRRRQGSTRSLSIPSGTVLKLTPEIKIPVSKSEDGAIMCSTEFVAAFPLSITFKELSWKKMAQELFVLDRRNDGVWDKSHLRYNPDENAILRSNHHRTRKSRDLMKSFSNSNNQTVDNGFTPAKVKRSGNAKCPVKSLADRKSILEQVEIAGLRMFGMDGNGKACLLRAVCELHEEGPVYHELGVLGEVVAVAFSFEEISRECKDEPEHLSLIKYLRPYIGAEVAGRAGACHAYHKGCARSIFT